LNECRTIRELLAILDPTGGANQEWLGFWNRRVQQRVDDKYKEIEEESQKELGRQSAEYQHYSQKPPSTQGCCSIS